MKERNLKKHKKSTHKSHSSSPRVLLFNLAHKQCNDVIKGWLHCLTSESKRGVLANNIFISGHGANQFSLINRDWTSRALARPHPPTFDNISFLPYPSPPPPPSPPSSTSDSKQEITECLREIPIRKGG